jgi:hypothetical protein
MSVLKRFKYRNTDRQTMDKWTDGQTDPEMDRQTIDLKEFIFKAMSTSMHLLI